MQCDLQLDRACSALVLFTGNVSFQFVRTIPHVLCAGSCVERLQARKSATFILTDRKFTCHGEVVGVKACGGSPSSRGTHFYLSLYTSSNDSGNNSILFPEAVRTQWGFAGGSAWKPVTRNERSANTPADSQGSKVCYSPGDFLGVTVYHQHGDDTRYARPRKHKLLIITLLSSLIFHLQMPPTCTCSSFRGTV